MKWINESAQNLGYSVYHASPERNPNIQYVIRQKRKTVDFTPTGWKVFVRSDSTQPLRTIFVAETLKDAKTFVDGWEKVHGAE